MARKYINNIAEEKGKFYIKIKVHGEQLQMLAQGATSRSQAQKILDSEKFKLRQKQAGLLKVEKKVPLSMLIKLYDNDAKINNKSYGKNPFSKYISLYFGKDTLVTKITPSTIEGFKLYLLDERKSSFSTVNKYIFALSKMFRLGIKNKLITDNPVLDVKKFQEDNHRVRYLTKEEEARLFEEIDKQYPYLRPIVTCALQTGMRRGEIFNLKWSNIDFEFGFIELLETKSGKSRKIPLTNKMLKVLEAQSKDNIYVFLNPLTGKPYQDIHKSFQTVLDSAGVEKFRFHDLRHTVATRMVEKGVPLPIVQEILGHAKISTTMRYTHTIPKQKREAIAVLDDY